MNVSVTTSVLVSGETAEQASSSSSFILSHLLFSQMWSCWRWTAPRPAAGSTTNCGLTRNSGRRTTAPSASAWIPNRTARQWPASRAARTRSRSPENAALSAKVRTAGFVGFFFLLLFVHHMSHGARLEAKDPQLGGSRVSTVLPQRLRQCGLIRRRPWSILGAAGSFVRLYYSCPPK